MIFIANFKQNKTSSDLRPWVEGFFNNIVLSNDNQVVVAPSFVHIPVLYMLLRGKPFAVSVASQDVSEFENGAHTGLVGATQLKEMCEYSIVGHSEARAHGDTNEIVNQKIRALLTAGIKPIVCFKNLEEFKAISNEFGTDKFQYAYEPLESIGTGNPASPDAISKMAKDTGLQSLIYGGSVNSTNVSDYKEMPEVSGFLVGSASLDPAEFKAIIS